MTTTRWVLTAIAMLGAGIAMRGGTDTPMAHAQTETRVFELRTYTIKPGKLDAMNARFRDQVVSQFAKNGMTLVGFWNASEAPSSDNTLVYILAHQSREAAKKNWAAWRESAEVTKMFAESGRYSEKMESMFLNPADFSPIK